MNKEIVNRLENDVVIATWDKGKDDSDPDCSVVRCEKCVHHEPHPDALRRDRWVYCTIYDTFKRCDGFCELGTDERRQGDA